MTDHLVIMAAGRGTRMGPLTATRPKVLLSVAGRPIVAHLVAAGAAAGFTRATLIVHAGADQVRAHFAAAPVAGIDVDFVDQGEPGGTGHAVAALADTVLADHFVLASGDTWLPAGDLARLRSAPDDALIAVVEVPDARPFGAITLAADGTVASVNEKPAGDAPIPGLVNAGAYRLPRAIIAQCAALAPSPRGERELTDAVAALPCLRPHRLATWLEAGRPWDLLEMNRALLGQAGDERHGVIESGVHIEGNVVIEDGAHILNGTRIEGPVRVAAGARIGPHAYLRPGTSIGRDCHIGASVEIKNSIIGDRSNVPHLSYVGDSVIGEDCNLGAGTQVANLKLTNHNIRVRWHGSEWVDTGRRKLGIIAGDDVKTGINATLHPGTVLGHGARVAAGGVAGGWIE